MSMTVICSFTRLDPVQQCQYNLSNVCYNNFMVFICSNVVVYVNSAAKPSERRDSV